MKILKTLSFLLLFSILLSAASTRSFATDSRGWYIKRQGSNRPIFPSGSDELSEFGVIYIDEKHGDDCAEKKLYLTFDAGYENGNVERILNTLREENIPSAFFVLDNLIIKNPELIKRMSSEGHLVCNHTKNHKDLSHKSLEEIREDLYALEDICREHTGVEMAKYFRFPEGKYSLSAIKHVRELGYRTVFWSFAYEDWDNGRQMSSDKAVKKILDNTHNGAVILLHPTSKTNADILPTLIKEWRKMGYSFGSLDEI